MLHAARDMAQLLDAIKDPQSMQAQLNKLADMAADTENRERKAQAKLDEAFHLKKKADSELSAIANDKARLDARERDLEKKAKSLKETSEKAKANARAASEMESRAKDMLDKAQKMEAALAKREARLVEREAAYDAKMKLIAEIG